MKIQLENVSPGSTSGPNYFSSKLKKYLEKLGCSFDRDPEISLCFTESREQKSLPLVQRLDGIWFNTSTNYRQMNANYQRTYAVADGVIYQSYFDQKLIEYHFGVHRNTTIIHNGSDLELIASLDPLEDSELDSVDKVWCCASHFAHRHSKRLDENIRYFLEHCGEKDVLYIAGTVDNNNFHDSKIKYLGNLPVEILLKVLKRSDYFIHLARLDHCPNVVVDARGAGCQIICSSLGGTVEIAGLDAIVIEEDEWDFTPFDYNHPTQLDFSKIVRSYCDYDISMDTVSKKYYNFLQEVKDEN